MKAVLLDANLLLLLVVGSMDRSEISRFKSTERFTVHDFDRLSEIVGKSGKLLTTPHVLTEVSNLANKLGDHKKGAFSAAFRLLIAEMQEHFQAASVLSQHPLFRFGLADVSLVEASFLQNFERVLVLTEDGRFAAQVLKHGVVAFDLKTAIALASESM